MPRKKLSYTRTTEVRDAHLYVIATEGSVTETAYFEELVSKNWYPNSRVHVKCLPTKNGHSSPRAVISRLDSYKKEFEIKAEDELWVVIDRDYQSWSAGQLAEVQQQCKQKKFSLAITNPAFEFWLLLHCEDLELKDKAILLQYSKNAKDTAKRGSTFCETQLAKKLGSYNKSKPDFSAILPNVNIAVARAKKITKENSIDLFSELGSNIYLLVEKLIG